MYKGIFIPFEFFERKELSQTERIVLAVYKFYTEKGTNHCCTLRNQDICKMIDLKNSDYLAHIKKHLKELGYIRTDGGIRVYYQNTDLNVGPTPTSESPDTDKKVSADLQKSQSDKKVSMTKKLVATDLKVSITDKKVSADLQKSQSDTDKKVSHNNNNNENNKLNEEEKIARANFKLIMAEVYPPLKSREGIEYLWDTHKEKLSSIDLSGGALYSWVQGFQDILRKKFPIQQVTPKPKTKSDTIDMF